MRLVTEPLTLCIENYEVGGFSRGRLGFRCRPPLGPAQNNIVGQREFGTFTRPPGVLVLLSYTVVVVLAAVIDL